MFKTFSAALALSVAAALPGLAAETGKPAAAAVDNSALDNADFRPHQRTYGLVFVVPDDVQAALQRTVAGPMKEGLLGLGLETEAIRQNIPHVTSLHIHNPDPETPRKMLAALPQTPGPVTVQLKAFTRVEAAKGAVAPWWADVGVVKQGEGYETLMAFNTKAVAALTPLRDGPLPRVTGPVYARMNDAQKQLVRDVGVSGLNVVKDGKELRAHNPHVTLVYSTRPATADSNRGIDELMGHFNAILPDGVPMTFNDVSIVELGFADNVTREIYRISLRDGSVRDIASGALIKR